MTDGSVVMMIDVAGVGVEVTEVDVLASLGYLCCCFLNRSCLDWSSSCSHDRLLVVCLQGPGPLQSRAETIKL